MVKVTAQARKVAHFPRSKGKTACGIHIQWSRFGSTKATMLLYASPSLTANLDSVTCMDCRLSQWFKNAEMTYEFLEVSEKHKWIDMLDLPKPPEENLNRCGSRFTTTIGEQLKAQQDKEKNAVRLLDLFGSRRPR